MVRVVIVVERFGESLSENQNLAVPRRFAPVHDVAFDEYVVDVVRGGKGKRVILLYNITKDHALWVIPKEQWDEINKEVEKELELCDEFESEEEKESFEK